jgi:hypothetical protein
VNNRSIDASDENVHEAVRPPVTGDLEVSSVMVFFSVPWSVSSEESSTVKVWTVSTVWTVWTASAVSTVSTVSTVSAARSLLRKDGVLSNA